MKKLSIGAFAVALFFAVSIPLMAAETQEALLKMPTVYLNKDETGLQAVGQTNRVVALQGDRMDF